MGGLIQVIDVLSRKEHSCLFQGMEDVMKPLGIAFSFSGLTIAVALISGPPHGASGFDKAMIAGIAAAFCAVGLWLYRRV